MKKTLVLALCATMALTACSGGASAGDSQAKGDSKQKLVLSTFGLSEDISTEEVYAPFEQEFNCEILTETGGANDRYTKLSADSETSIDVIELSQAMTAKGIAEGLFEDIDLSKIENAKDMITAAKTMADAGQGVAYTINSIGIMVYMASDHAGVDIKSDNGEAAFAALAELRPNLVKTYAKSSDLINMFTSGEVAVAVVGDFGVPTIQQANPDLVYVTPDVTYANFNTISITKNCKNKELAYAYLNYRLSAELQTKTGKALNEAPTNSKVSFTEEESKNMTYGEKAANAKVLDYSFVNPLLNDWIDRWNRTINN